MRVTSHNDMPNVCSCARTVCGATCGNENKVEAGTSCLFVYDVNSYLYVFRLKHYVADCEMHLSFRFGSNENANKWLCCERGTAVAAVIHLNRDSGCNVSDRIVFSPLIDPFVSPKSNAAAKTEFWVRLYDIFPFISSSLWRVYSWLWNRIATLCRSPTLNKMNISWNEK